ncbi:hypothetical protein LA329_04510 [Corynebacterium falsenii]|uniref:hypothetical protein n=1 Tax=Corynebacterium falsenii TaxID=108486 RepID=UPI001CC96B2C|nr:hypothetical protein [Corynebacterium falsenii]UBI07571.1 hypothetical protein LA329_04510 [Corynebacterium falsenii]
MPSGNEPQWGRSGDHSGDHLNDETRIQPAVNNSPRDQWGSGPQGPQKPQGPHYVYGGPPQQPQQPQQPQYQQQPPWQRAQPQQLQQPQQAQYIPEESSPRRRSKDGWIAAGIVVLIIVVVIALGAFLYQNYFSDNGDSSASGASGPATSASSAAGEQGASDGVSSSASSSDATSSSQEAGRPRDPELPSGAIPANDAARSGAPAGDFNNVYRGTTITSEPFAQAVRDAFVRYYLDTDKTTGMVDAYSSVTGKHYSMDCSDNGDYVTCRGGNDAVVYIS